MNFWEFFTALHDHPPFPWQARAAERLIKDEALDAVTVPTGSGKTAMLDAALYHAAQGGPRRIFFIIDRRVVVDEAHERAKRIQHRLEERPELAEMRQRLGEIQVIRLRGGIQGDDDWIWHPERTSLILSTVDQVGSRLLHRGYGVSSRMWPMHAGMVGNQALYLIDEAHLSTPFVSTVDSARRQGADIRVIQLSATLADETPDSLGLNADDLTHPLLAKRLAAPKPVCLDTAPDADSQFAPRLVERALTLLAESPMPNPVIAIVANRVKTARAIWQGLARHKQAAELLIGPIRPLDRDRLMARVLPETRTGRSRHRSQPLFIVATQTIEVGADLDFDALITEAAPLSALRQRFGRLDRLGENGASLAWIIAREGQIDPGKADKAPVYGRSLLDTWQWLKQAEAHAGRLDFGILAMQQTLAALPPPVEPQSHCPALLPGHVDLLSQTGPDAPRFDPGPWLHGPQRRSREVGVVWRADLNDHNRDNWAELMALFPPHRREAVQVPITALRDLLSGKGNSDIFDLEGADATETSQPVELRHYLIWSDQKEEWQKREGTQLPRPGDSVILPAHYGGHDEFGWAFTASSPVDDIAEDCALEGDGTFCLRLAPGLTRRLGADKPLLDALNETLIGYRAACEDPSGDIEPQQLEQAKQTFQKALAAIDHPWVQRLGSDYTINLTTTGAVLTQKRLQDLAGATTAGVAVPLDEHLAGVEAMAARITQGHPAEAQIRTAAREHDLGKQARVFQILMHGDPLRAAAGPLLAKSGLRSQRALRAALQGFPRGFRHELHSLDLMQHNDPLVHHLVATHHGYGRPWFPPCADPNAPGVQHNRLDQHWAARFAQLRRQLGPWQLAGLELLLRAADIRRSIEEQQNGVR